MTITSRELYGELRRALAPALQARGFKPLASGTLAYTRPTGPGALTLWFQADRYGWDALWGSRFTLELQLADQAAAGTASIAQRARYFHLLPPEQREQVRLRNNAVIAQLPGTAAHAQVVVPDEDGEDVVVFGVAVQHQPHPAGADVWMHYGALADITAWAQFLDSALEAMAQALGAAQTATR